MKYIHFCIQCSRYWGHVGCDGIGNRPSRAADDVCWECDPQAFQSLWHGNIRGLEYQDSFEMWVHSIRKEAGL